MKNIIYAFIFNLGLYSCNNGVKGNAESKPEDILNNNVQQRTGPGTGQDSVISFSDSLYSNFEPTLKEVPDSVFSNLEKTYKTACPLDTGGFITGKGLRLGHYCSDICESYLADEKENMKLILPSGFDNGIIGLLFSPSCNQFIVYSSYDGPGYKTYYGYRAEIFGFTVGHGQGLRAIKPSFKYYTTKWSIENVTWADNNTLALKLYVGERSGNATGLKYSYFKTRLK